MASRTHVGAIHPTLPRVRVGPHPGISRPGRRVYHIIIIVVVVYRKRQACAPTRTKCSIFMRAREQGGVLPPGMAIPTHKRNGIRRRPTVDYHLSGGRQWAAQPNGITGVCGVRARSLVPRDSCDRTAPHHHHHHRQSSYGHNIRYNSLLRFTIIVSWPIVIVIIFICGIVSLWRSKLRNQCLRCARHNFYASSQV